MNRKSISLRQCIKLNDSKEQEGFCWRLSGALHLCANMHLTCCTRQNCIIEVQYIFHFDYVLLMKYITSSV